VEWVSLVERSGLENRREIEVPAGITRIRLAENAGSGWEYRRAGGDWRPVRRGPDASMVLELGAAADEAALVEMRYRPPLRRAGLGISGFALLAALLVAMLGGKPGRHAAAEASPLSP
jgi:hypothetical protein